MRKLITGFIDVVLATSTIFTVFVLGIVLIAVGWKLAMKLINFINI